MQKKIRPYEILVRFHPDGTTAAHVVSIEDIIDDDGVTVTASREVPPKPLALAGPEFDALIPALDQAVVANSAQLLRQIGDLTDEKKATEAEVAQLRSDLEGHQKPQPRPAVQNGGHAGRG